MTALKAVEREYEALDVFIKAAEDWEGGYRDNREAFGLLLKSQSRFERKLRAYFKDLAERVEPFVDWADYNRKRGVILAADDISVTVDEKFIAAEERLLLTIYVYENATALVAGGIAAAVDANLPLPLPDLEEFAIRANREYGAKLVTEISKTTRRKIINSVETSLSLGEDQPTAAARLRKIIKDPKRAELIAQTETVNAYARGGLEFARASGATHKIWLTAGKPCRVCSNLEGKKIGVDEYFLTLTGRQILGPTAHPRCKCRNKYVYPPELTGTPTTKRIDPDSPFAGLNPIGFEEFAKRVKDVLRR